VRIQSILKKVLIVLVIAAAIGFAIVFVMSKVKPEGGTVVERIEKLNPFTPNNGTSGTNPDGSTQDVVVPVTIAEPKQFRLLADTPTSGYVVFNRPRTITEQVLDPKTNKMITRQTTIYQEVVRRIQKATGHMFENIVEPDSITVRQISKTYIPRTEEVAWGAAGDTVFMRFADDQSQIQTFVGRVPADPVFFQCGIQITEDLKVGSKGAQVAELQKFLGFVLGFTVKADGSFGAGTQARVKEFQALAQVSDWGTVDQATREAITKRCAEEKAKADAVRNEPKELAGGFYDSNIQRMVGKPDLSQVFYTKTTGTRGVGFTMQTNQTALKQVFDAPLTEWIPDWVSEKIISMQTAASGVADGYLFLLDPVTLGFKKALGPLPGLTAKVSPDGTSALISTATETSIQVSLRSLVTGDAIQLSRPTIAGEKCVWAPDSSRIYCAIPQDIASGTYPDDWYQGIARFTDEVWEINPATGDYIKRLAPNGDYDFTQLTISPNGQNLYMIDRATGFLFVLNLGIEG
jgi:peptidoglycan hydrolase-like protein with peptidoglycan-binding domain